MITRRSPLNRYAEGGVVAPSKLGDYWRSLSASAPPLSYTPRAINRGSLSQINLADPSAAMFGLAPQPIYWKPSPGVSLAPGQPAGPALGGLGSADTGGLGGPGSPGGGPASTPGPNAVGSTPASPVGPVGQAVTAATLGLVGLPPALAAPLTALVNSQISQSNAAAAAAAAADSPAPGANPSAPGVAPGTTGPSGTVSPSSISPEGHAAISGMIGADAAASDAAAAANAAAVGAATSGSAIGNAAEGEGGIGVGDSSSVGSSAADAPDGIGGIGGVGSDGSDGGGGGGGGGGCFLTEAVMSSGGKDDNAEELQVMRAFRDDYLLTNESYAPLVEEYYRIAPLVVEALNKRPDAQKIYQFIDKRFIQPAVRMVLEGGIEPAFQHYADMIEFVTPFAEEVESRQPEREAMNDLEEGAAQMSASPPAALPPQGGALSMMEQ